MDCYLVTICVRFGCFVFSGFGLLVGCLTDVVGLVLLTGCFVWVDLLYVMKLAADARVMLVLV